MKKNLLLAAASLFVCTTSFAQWVKPELPVPETCALETTTVDEAATATAYYLYNVEGKAFYGHGNAWNTRASLVTAPHDYFCSEHNKTLTAEPMQIKLVKDADPENGTQLYGIMWVKADGGTDYTSPDNPDGIWVDGTNRPGWNEFSITPTEGNNFTIGCNLHFEGGLLGVLSTNPSSMPEINLYNPAEVTDATLYSTWALVTVDAYNAARSEEDVAKYQEALPLYNAAVELKAAIDKAKADYPDVDCSKAEAVYNNTNSTVEELQDAKKLVANAIAALRSQEVLAGASADNPIDGTVLLENPDFSANNISGWVCTFEKGTTATNVGYQGSKYTGLLWTDDETGESGTAFMEKFIEAWANNVDEMKRDGKTFATIGDAKLCQTIYGLPAGKYKLSCDANAVQQWEGSQNPVTGVQLYAIGGGIDSHINMATGNGIPEHFILTFIHKGGDVELGLRTEKTTANWIGADNFRIVYYGEITQNPYQVLLSDAAAAARKQYGDDIDQVVANATVKEAFMAALDAAEAAEDGNDDAYYQNLQAQLDEAQAALKASVEAYKAIGAKLDEAYDRMSNVPDNWADLSSNISDKYYEWKDKYDSGLFETGDEAVIAAELNQMIADFISANAQAGDDVTILLQNPNFDKNFSGWQKAEGSATPAWGGCKKNPEGVLEGHEELEEYRETGLPGGNAEVYHNSFDIFQTVKNMPAGLYELSCKAFERDENGKVDAELYAVLAGGEQSVKVMEIKEDLAPVEIYHYGEETPDGNNSRQFDGGWAPDGMSSANWHFAAGYYKNKFNIIVTEAGDITVGIRTASKGDWVLFDDFKLVYMGGGAAVYEQPIRDLIAKGDAAVEAGYEYMGEPLNCISNEVVAAWEKLVSECNEVWTKSEEECVAAIDKLNEAIAAIEASVALGHKVYDAYNAGNEKMSIVEEKYNITCDDVLEAIENIYNALDGDGYATNADMEAAIEAVNATFTKDIWAAAEAGEATEEAPVDITAVLSNTTYDWNVDNRNAYWTNTGKAPHGWYEGGIDEKENSYVTGEVFNGTFTHSQTVCALPAGFYRLHVNAFQRGAHFNKHSEQAANDTIGEPLTAKLFAGAATTKVASLFSDVDKYAELCVADDGTVPGAKVEGGLYDGKVVPNNMAQAVAAFNAGLYKNILQFEVKEKGNVEMGLSKAETQSEDWVIFGGWKLEYLGTTKPATDPTTEIAGIEAAPAVRAIYDLMGRKVNNAVKGIYIINGKKVVK